MQEEMTRKQVNDKILILGVDALDPRATAHYLQEGKLPNIQKFLDRGAANKDLEMLGGHPTGTPPMWTTLATGLRICTGQLLPSSLLSVFCQAHADMRKTRPVKPLWLPGMNRKLETRYY